MKLDLWEENDVYELLKEKIITLKQQIKEEEELIEIYKRYDTGSIQQKSSRKKAYYNHLDKRNNYQKKYLNLQKLFSKFTNRDR
jgi:hypothetical protein|tara:strand:+ start:475 stop:726 length:252 start_codon:yes stop_codon:yes gene_type:complete